MNRFDIINRIGDKYRIGNTETGEFSYAQALKTVFTPLFPGFPDVPFTPTPPGAY